MSLLEHVRSAQAKLGVLPVPRQPTPRRKDTPAAVYVYGALHPDPPECWLRPFAEDECAGPFEHAHLISQRALRDRNLSHLLGHEAVWVFACRKHHHGLDSRLSVVVPRDALPVQLERFAVAHDLEAWLDRRYGERVA